MIFSLAFATPCGIFGYLKGYCEIISPKIIMIIHFKIKLHKGGRVDHKFKWEEHVVITARLETTEICLPSLKKVRAALCLSQSSSGWGTHGSSRHSALAVGFYAACGEC